MDKELLNAQAEVFVDEILKNPEIIDSKKTEVEKMSSDIINGNYDSVEDLREKSRPTAYLLNKMSQILNNQNQDTQTKQQKDMAGTIQDSLMSINSFVMDRITLDRMQNNDNLIDQNEDLTQILRKASTDLNNIKPSSGKPGLIQKIKNLANDFTNSDKTNTNKPK